jgi:hypothetical protein
MRLLPRRRRPVPELHVDPNVIAKEPLDHSGPTQSMPNSTDADYAEVLRFNPFRPK